MINTGGKIRCRRETSSHGGFAVHETSRESNNATITFGTGARYRLGGGASGGVEKKKRVRKKVS